MAAPRSPAFDGVRRIVIACGPTAGLSETEARAFCAQMAQKADALSTLPVELAGRHSPIAPERSSDDLVLEVRASAAAVDDGRKALTVAITPRRNGRTPPAVPAPSRADFKKVGSAWLLQGPVGGLLEIFRHAPRDLHRPVRAEGRSH